MALISEKSQKGIKLDLYDKKILTYLSENSRMPRKQLAKQLRISQQRLHYKIERLTKELIEPTILINYQAIGLKMYLLFLPRLFDETKKQIMEDPSVVFFMQTVGKYQYIINVVTSNIDDFCKKMLFEYNLQIIEVIKQIPDLYNPFLITKHEELIKKDQKIKLDKKDFTLLSQLSRNSLISEYELSNLTKIDRQTIKTRMKKMKEANIIQKFRYSMNIHKLGYFVYLLKFDTTPSFREKIVHRIRSNYYSGIIFVTHTGFVLFYMPPSYKDLFTFIEEIQMENTNIHIEILQNTEYFKIDPSPANIIENYLTEFD